MAGEVSERTGYSLETVMRDFDFVSSLLRADVLERALDCSLPGGAASLEGPVEVAPGEFYRSLPAGPVLVIGSGNSAVPALISAALSLLTGNLTLVRPSRSNSPAVREVVEAVPEPLSGGIFLVKSDPEGALLRYLLESAPVGVVNVWGGAEAVSAVCSRAASNPARPRVVAFGPMVGYAVVEEGADLGEAADALAEAVSLYDQQLCSSPVEAAFVGSRGAAEEFCSLLAEAMGEWAERLPIELGEYGAHLIQSLRRVAALSGSRVYAPRGPEWTVLLSEGPTALAEAARLGLSLAARRRLIEVVRADSEDYVVRRVGELASLLGVDGVQTVGVAPGEAIPRLARALGVHRVVPLRGMHVRPPLEPLDGVHLAREFVRVAYWRV
ncbi:MAG: hypothetical protein DRO06_04080 [Thermoproteota archaeon]|nr:MAG: hypothetical protein DRO06_04080 [Candidatus Korarchaeota archaeon]